MKILFKTAMTDKNPARFINKLEEDFNEDDFMNKLLEEIEEDKKSGKENPFNSFLLRLKTQIEKLIPRKESSLEKEVRVLTKRIIGLIKDENFYETEPVIAEIGKIIKEEEKANHDWIDKIENIDLAELIKKEMLIYFESRKSEMGFYKFEDMRIFGFGSNKENPSFFIKEMENLDSEICKKVIENYRKYYKIVEKPGKSFCHFYFHINPRGGN